MDKFFKFLLWTAGILAVIALAGRVFLFETWTVPDDSYLAAAAAPTLHGGDFVLVLTVGTGGFGDLVRCADPENAGSFVVGRIVGTPGDEVEMQGRSLRVNTSSYNASDACTQATFKVAHPDTGREMEMQCSRVEMGGGWHYRGNSLKNMPGNNVSKRIGDGKVYLLSDNRDMHDDSRDFGTLPEESCRQRIVFRLWGRDGWTDSAARMTFIR